MNLAGGCIAQVAANELGLLLLLLLLLFLRFFFFFLFFFFFFFSFFFTPVLRPFSGQNLRKDFAGEKLELALAKMDSQILMLVRKTALITEACARIRYANHGQDESFCVELMRRPEGKW